mgnify:FL=1
MTATKVLKSTFFVLGFICLIIFILARINNGLKILIDPEIDNTGDLYKQSSITNFREILPDKAVLPNNVKKSEFYTHKEGHPYVSDAEILTFGDSYFYFTRFTSFPEYLSLKTNKKVFFAAEANPFYTLKHENYSAGQSKYLIYETGERGIFERFKSKLNIDTATREEIRTNTFIIREPGEVEKIYSRFFQLGYFTWQINEYINTFKFQYLDYINEATPVYSTDPPMLFYRTTVNSLPGSYQYDYSEAELNDIAENISYMNDMLDSLYNLKLVFMPVPNKISIYDTTTELKEYNMLLPKLYEKLDKKGIEFIDLYHPFKRNNELLYYRTDTHWNEQGMKKACNILVDKYIIYD